VSCCQREKVGVAHFTTIYLLEFFLNIIIMSTLNQIFNGDCWGEIELTTLSQTRHNNQSGDIEPQAEQKPEISGNRGRSRSSLIGSKVRLTATLFALLLVHTFNF
jgi:hypothetical protein